MGHFSAPRGSGPRLLVVLLVVLIVGTAAGRAEAQTAVQLDAAVSLGYSNFRDTPNQVNTNAGGTNDTGPANFYTDVRPTLALQQAWSRLILRASLGFTGTFRWDGTNTYAFRAEVGAAALATRRVTLLFGALASESTVNSALTQAAPDAVNANFRPLGNPSLFGVGGFETLLWEITPTVRFGERANVNLSAPIYKFLCSDCSDPLNLNAGTHLGDFSYTLEGALFVDKVLGRHSVGAEVRESYQYLVPPPQLVGGQGMQPLQVVTQPTLPVSFTTALLRWRADLTARWNANLAAGATLTVASTDLEISKRVWPTAQGGINFFDRRGGAGLFASYGAAPNLLLGAVTQNFTVGLRGTAALNPKQPVLLSLGAAFTRSDLLVRPIMGMGAIAQLVAGSVFAGDASVLFHLRDYLYLSARYSLAIQLPDSQSVTTAGQTSSDQRTLVHTVLLGVVVRYLSARPLVRLPSGAGDRVDSADAQPFPDVHPPPPPPASSR